MTGYFFGHRGLGVTLEASGRYRGVVQMIALVLIVEAYMSNFVEAKIEILATRTLLQHQFGPEALPLDKGERTGVSR